MESKDAKEKDGDRDNRINNSIEQLWFFAKNGDNARSFKDLFKTICNEPIDIQQYVFEDIFTKAIQQKSIKFLRFVLFDPDYQPFIKRLSKDRISKLYDFVVKRESTPPYEGEELSALLETHFVFKSKAQLIFEYIQVPDPEKNKKQKIDPKEIKQYLPYYFHTDQEFLTLVDFFKKEKVLHLVSGYILEAMFNKIDQDIAENLPVRSFDQAIMALFDSLNLTDQKMVLGTFTTRGSLEMLEKLAEQFKLSIRNAYNEDLYRELELYRHSSRGTDFVYEYNERRIKIDYCVGFINCLIDLSAYQDENMSFDLREKKAIILIEASNLLEDASFLFEPEYAVQKERFKHVVSFLSLSTLSDFMKKADKFINMPLYFCLDNIIRHKKKYSIVTRMTSVYDEQRLKSDAERPVASEVDQKANRDAEQASAELNGNSSYAPQKNRST